MKTKEELEERISKVLKAGEQHDYDREDNLVPVYNYAEVKENIVFLADEYAKQIAELAFDAGYALAAKHETNHPDDAITKEEFIKKYFQ